MTFIFWKLKDGKKETVAKMSLAVSGLAAKEQKEVLRELYSDKYDFDGIDMINE